MATRLPRLLFAARRVSASFGLRMLVFGALALWASWTPLGQAGGLNDFRDSHLLHSYEEAAVRTLTHFGQVPLWNPWSCGGLYALGNPQTRLASPTLLLSAAVGARRAEPLLLFAFLVVAMEGAFRYARLRARSTLGPFLAAPTFGLAGFFAIAWTLGWLNFLGFALLPWLLLGTAHAVRGRIGGVALVVGGFAWMLGFGGTYPVPLCALFVVLEALRGLFSRQLRARRLNALLVLAATALLTLGACAFRLWPILETMQSAPRIMAGAPGHSLQTMARMLVWFPSAAGSNGGPAGIVYVGPAIFVLVAAAGLTRRAAFPLVAAVLAGWLAAGHAAIPSLFGLMRELPVLETLRYPERFLLPFSVYLCELGALGVTALLARARQLRWAQRAVVAVCALAVVGWAIQAPGFGMLSQRAMVVPAPTPVDQPFAQARGNRWAQGYFLALNRGSIACGEAYPVPMSKALRGELPQEEALEDWSAGAALRRSWTPNRLDVEVDAKRPTVLRVNQNWHPGWKTSVGEVLSRDGLLAVSLPAGRHLVTLRFLPRSALGGAAVSALAATCLALLAWRTRRRGQLSGPEACVWALLPLAMWALLALLWHERPAPPHRGNPDGTPILVETSPVDASHVGAHFDVPVELVAARVPSAPDARDILPVELYWRVTGGVPRSASIFVHVTGPGKRKSADHDAVAGSYLLAHAPREQLLRDAFAVSTRDAEPGTWEVWVGLWHASGDHSRIPVRDAGGTTAPEARIRVGTFTVPARSPAVMSPP
ncbi:MAG: hypothetical protein L0Y66_04955 [Myxococcaceae bacterium]|nr:hypothetical protein [Myxococcaceae bacterium]